MDFYMNGIRGPESTSTEENFLLPVYDVFEIKERHSTVVTGCISSGKVSVGDVVWIIDNASKRLSTVVSGIEMNRELIDYAQKGDSVGLLLHGITENDVKAGYILFSDKAAR